MGERTTGELTAPASSDRLAPGRAAQLVAGAAKGDSTAWGQLVQCYAGLVWAIARNHRLSSEDAADAVQLTWLRLLEHLDRLKSPGRVGAWLATTARRESVRLLPRARREVSVPDLAELTAAVTRDLGVAGLVPEEEAEVLRRVGEVFVALPARSQALMRLLVLDPPPSYAEIGNALDMPVGSIGPTRGRCLKALRDHLGPDMPYRVPPVRDR